MNYRNRALLNLAYELDCTLRLDGCTGGTGEPAHANWAIWGKGGGMKAHDFAFASACRHCHMVIDQGSRLTAELREAYWLRGHVETMRQLWERGLLRVATDAKMTSTGRRTLATKGNTKQDGLTREQVGKWLDKRGRKYAPPIKRVKRPEVFQR